MQPDRAKSLRIESKSLFFTLLNRYVINEVAVGANARHSMPDHPLFLYLLLTERTVHNYLQYNVKEYSSSDALKTKETMFFQQDDC